MSDFPISNARSRVKPTWTGLALAIVVVVVWSLGFILQHRLDGVGGTADMGQPMAQALGVATGAALAGAVAVWLILYFTHVRPVAPSRGLVHLAVLAAAGLLVAAPAAGFKVLVAAYSSENATLQEIRIASDEAVDAYLLDIHNERERILADGFFEPHALAAPGGVARARRKVAQLRALIDRSIAESARLDLGTRATIAALPMSEPRRRAALRAFDRDYAAAQEESEADVALARSVFDEMDAQLDVLSRSPRAWSLEYGSLTFRRSADLADFNAHVVRLNEISRQLETRDREITARRGGY